MQLTFVGFGEAFGSGGRFNTCVYVEAANTRFLIECGAWPIANAMMSAALQTRKKTAPKTPIDARAWQLCKGNEAA